MKINQKYIWAAAAVLTGVSASAQTVDGTKDASYGSAITLQTINTGFGNTGNTGSELDGAYAQIVGGNLFLMLTGDLQPNGNHLDLFFDTGASGQNVLNAASGNMKPWSNLTLTKGFNASRFITVNSPDATTAYVDSSTYGGSSWADTYLGSGAWSGSNGTLSGGTSGGVEMAVNDSNNSQMGASGTAANQAYVGSVTTGVEFMIPLSFLGNPTGDIKVIADINGGGDGYLSNQFLSGLSVGTGNLGGDGNGNYVNGNLAGINLNNYGSPEFIIHQQSVPEPTGLLALAPCALALIRRRRR